VAATGYAKVKRSLTDPATHGRPSSLAGSNGQFVLTASAHQEIRSKRQNFANNPEVRPSCQRPRRCWYFTACADRRRKTPIGLLVDPPELAAPARAAESSIARMLMRPCVP
jgi:superfamily II RNA helicase